MKPVMFTMVLLIVLLTAFSAAQQKPKFIKVELEEGIRVDHNTSISA